MSIDTELGKALCNFAGITSDNADLGGGQLILNLGSYFGTLQELSSDNVDPRWGVQSTLNLGSHFATLLGLPLTMLIGGSIDTQLGKSLCNLAGDYL